MVDKIIELENNKKYVILDSKKLDGINYYFGLRLDKNETPTNNYLFFEESKIGSEVYLAPVEDDNTKGILLTAFTINYLNKVYDIV